MGFSTCLQGRTAHEALLQRQDAELRLLETMRRCLMNKVKCDREYAIALSSVANQGLKIDRSEELVGSLVTSAWRSTMEEVDNIGKLIRQNADAMETRAIDRLAAMCTEKRRARKQYQEEHNRISQQFTHVSISLHAGNWYGAGAADTDRPINHLHTLHGHWTCFKHLGSIS